MGLRRAQGREIQTMPVAEAFVKRQEIRTGTYAAAVHESVAPIVRAHKGQVPTVRELTCGDVDESIVCAGPGAIPARF